MKIALLGDLIFSGKFCLAQNDQLFEYFEEVAKFLGEFDHVVGNLETPFATDQKPFGAKSAHIKSDLVNLKLLEYLSVDVVTLANNHIYDFGRESYELTKTVLSEQEIDYFGVEGRQVILKDNTAQVALHGYCCYSTNPFGMEKGVDRLDVDAIESNLRKNVDKGYYNIVGVHCGQEHVHTPNYDHVLLARRLSNIAPFLWYGHHPHVIQGYEEVNAALMAYSLGNFCIDDVYTPKSAHPIFTPKEMHKKTLVLCIEVIDNELVSYEFIPLYMNEEKMEVGNVTILDELHRFCDQLNVDPELYISSRNKLFAQYISKRKQLRDLKWYLKRMNLSSVKHILDTRSNSKLYNKHVKSKLEQI